MFEEGLISLVGYLNEHRDNLLSFWKCGAILVTRFKSKKSLCILLISILYVSHGPRIKIFFLILVTSWFLRSADTFVCLLSDGRNPLSPFPVKFVVGKTLISKACSFYRRLIFYCTLTLSLQRPLSYRNQSIDWLCKSMNWFLYDKGLRYERVTKAFFMEHLCCFCDCI